MFIRLYYKHLHVDYSQMICVGDNPYRDFVNIKKAGVTIFRIMRDCGQFTHIKLPELYEAHYSISSLCEIADLLERKFLGIK